LSRPSAGEQVTVGVFHGGVARQVVPDRAQLLVDLRAPTSDDADALLQRMRGVIAAAGADGVTLALSGAVTRPAFPRVASQSLWRPAAARAAALGIPLVAHTSRGGSDASFAAALGIPTLDGLGPICHDSCARGERIEIASLATRGALMALLICDLAAAWRDQARASGNVEAPA